MKTQKLFILIIVLLTAEGAFGLNCYVCSKASENCLVGNPETKPFNCSSFTDADRKDSPKYCFKTATFVAGKAEMVIHRGCLVGDAKNFCDLERDKDSKLSCSLCSTTLCNSGAFVTVSKIILAIAIFNSLWIYMF